MSEELQSPDRNQESPNKLVSDDAIDAIIKNEALDDEVSRKRLLKLYDALVYLGEDARIAIDHLTTNYNSERDKERRDALAAAVQSIENIIRELKEIEEKYKTNGS